MPRNLCLRCLPAIALFLLSTPLLAAPPAEIDDPLQPILENELQPTVATLLDHYRAGRLYKPKDFPLPPERFTAFREDLIQRLTRSLDLEDWVVRKPSGKSSPIAHRFRDRLLKTIRHHGVEMEIHLIELPETGDRIPAVLCLPDTTEPRPAVAVFTGHSKNGLHDLVVDLDSYQSGIATRLAQAGFVSIAVEKLDAGYLSGTSPSGVDEEEIATWRLGMNKVTRSVQLMASLAALEILAQHPRVDHTQIGTTGVSLGGWLAVQAALLSDRVTAVADFGRKTVFLPEDTSAADFEAVRDKCHILPGMFEVGDRNLLLLAYAPRPMLAGHGRNDKGSHEQAPRYYRDLFQAQYESLGRGENFEYHIHNGGDTMPPDAVIEYFRRTFGLPSP
jgi:dienelactone hydrolase